MSGLYSLNGISPQVSPEAWIAPGARIMGNVVIEAGASVWFNAVLRGDNEQIVIGEGSNVQDLAMLHTDIGFPIVIGRNCTVGHTAILHGCTLGDHALVGMGATVLNGAQIGDYCLVGANALITEGKAFDEGQLIVGSPAKAVRALDDAARAGLEQSALGYQMNAKRFRDGLEPL